jgi:DNA-binding MarR family transcriptional regulator
MSSGRDRLLEEIDELAVRLAVQSLEEQTCSLMESSLTLQQFRLLLHVNTRGPLPIHQAADTLGLAPSVATGVVQRLVDRGLIERYEDAHDRRARLLRVTDLGATLIEEMSTAVRSQRRQSFERLNNLQLQQLRDILAAIAS